MSDPSATITHMSDLNDEHRAILELERSWWKHAGAKDAVIRERFDVSPTRYYQMLGALLEDPAALAYDAMLVRRLVRLRERRRAVRAG